MAMPAHAACSTLASGVIPYLEHNSAGLVTVRTTPTTTAGFAPVEGTLAYDTTNDVVKACDGTSWNTVSVGASTGVTDRISSSGNQAIVLAMPGGTVSFTTGSVAGTSYLDSTGRWVGPGISLTTYNGISSTNGYFSRNVGIGTTAPTVPLQVTGAANSHFRINPNATSDIAGFYYAAESEPRIGFSQYATGVDYSLIFRPAGTVAANGAAIGTGGGTQRTLAFYTSNGSALTERLRIDNTGLVGIGTTTPSGTLSISGTVAMSLYSAAPTACSATYKGLMALTSAAHMCVCDGASWVDVDGRAACSW